MASQLRTEDDIATAYAETERLIAARLRAERRAGGLLDGEEAADRADGDVVLVREELIAALIKHRDLTHRALASRCDLHGASIIAACDRCRLVHGLDERRVA